MPTVDTDSAVQAFVDAANELRQHDNMEVCYALLRLMKSAPIKVFYALHIPAQVYLEHCRARLPEE